ncbi:MAG: hypothetical protein J0M24_00250 [Verrucomicrobia bacterium]|nr:hypothetical protein [Verrucomicrobiota bacterium]
MSALRQSAPSPLESSSASAERHRRRPPRRIRRRLHTLASIPCRIWCNVPASRI